MFNYCSKLETLDLSSFDTSNVKSMAIMFKYCFVLTNLDISSFDTSNVTTMNSMFYCCTGLTQLDLSSFNTKKVTNMGYMFYTYSWSTKLKTIYVSDNFDTSGVTTSTNMFYGCAKLVGGAGTVYSADHINKEYAIIDGTGGNPGYFTQGYVKPVIKDSTGSKINLASIAEHYGDYVKYKGTTDKYQLFLVDTAGKYSNGEPRIWLQYNPYVGGVKLNSHYETTGINTANSILWQVNPDLDSKYGSIIRGLSTWNENLKGVAYLCNPERWNTTYVASEDVEKGAYAIGGVSAEMFCDSYNQARGIISTSEVYFEAKAFNKNSTYGYWYKPNGMTNEQFYDGDYGNHTNYSSYPLPTNEYGGMYRPGSSQYTWLTSPSAGPTDNVCCVGGNNGRLTAYVTSYNYGVRPAVSLPADVQIQLEN